jgi:hypothetical protein
MRKFLATSITVMCGVVAFQGCGRNGSPTAPAQVVPTSSSAVQAIQIAGSSTDKTFIPGQKVQLRAVARLSNGSEEDITGLATWMSDNPSVATVSSGLVTAVERGTALVRASYQNAAGETSFSVVDDLAGSSGTAPTIPQSSPTGGESPAGTTPDGSTPGGSLPGGSAPGGSLPGGSAPGGSTDPTIPATPPTVQRLVITGEDTIPTGRSGQFRAIAYMSDGSQKDVTASSDWRSDDSLVGSISQSGLFTGLMPGSNVVTANYNGATASQPVQVTPL